MISKFFFIPADRIKFINKIPDLKADHFILDFEDSIKSTSLNLALKNIKSFDNVEKLWVRPFLFNYKSEFNLTLLNELIEIGVRQFVLPKIFSVDHLEQISNINNSNKCEFILLIESAKAYINIEHLLKFKSLNIFGLTLGSHDFANDLGMKHGEEELRTYRQNILLFAKAYDIIPIDIASMEINNINSFKEEVLTGFNMGYRAKMFLHPLQLEALNEIIFFSNEEIIFAKKVKERYPNLSYEMEAIKFEGRILERPHIKRFLEIIKSINHDT